MKAGDALQPTSTATCVRIRNGKTLTTDGPFAETKEQLGGYYLIEAKDLDEATKIAARVPSAQTRHDRGAAGPGVRGLTAASCRRSGYLPGRRADASREAVERVFKQERGRILATLIRVLGDIDLGEEALAAALEAALVQWPSEGTPANPRAWLIRAARNKAIDRMRRRALFEDKRAEMEAEAALGTRGRRARARRRGVRARRSAAPHLHLLPPGAGRRGAGRADAAHAVRPRDGGDRARVPGAGADDGAAAGAREGEDPAGAHPVPRSRRRGSSASGSTPCWRSSTSCSTRAMRPARAPR